MTTTFDFNQLLILTDDDPEFRSELINQYAHSFEAFPDTYAQVMRQGTVEDIRFLIHKVKATVRMVGGDELDRILNQSLDIHQASKSPEESITRVRELCLALVSELRRIS